MPLFPCTDQEWLALTYIVIITDAYWDPTCLDSPYDIENEIWYNAQSCIPQCPSDATFNEHGEFKKINEQDMHYFDAFKYNSHDEIGSLINTCA